MGNSFVRLFRWFLENEVNQSGGHLGEVTILKLIYQTLCLLLACYVLTLVYDLYDYWMSIIRMNDD